MLVLEGSGDQVLVFLPGFLSAAASYRALLEPVAAAGATVIVPQLYPRGIAALAGRVPVSAEAAAAADLVRGDGGPARHRIRSSSLATRGVGRPPGVRLGCWRPRGCPLGWSCSIQSTGRGGGPAHLARRPHRPPSPARRWSSAPAWVAGAPPGPSTTTPSPQATPHARHVVVKGFGHADVLEGRARSLGRRLCGGADDPDPGRAAVLGSAHRASRGGPGWRVRPTGPAGVA